VVTWVLTSVVASVVSSTLTLSSLRFSYIVKRWLIGTVFFLAVLAGGMAVRATGYGEAPRAPEQGAGTGPVVSVVTTLPAAGAATSSTEPRAVAAPDPGSDDALLLERPAGERIARVDHDAFPGGDDPSDPDGTAYYVASGGDDSGPGSSELPFARIERALSVAADGDRVIVHAGVYPSGGLTVTQSRFSLAAAGDGVVVVQADGPDAGYGLAVSAPGQHDVLVRGLTIAGFDSVGVHYGNPVAVERLVFEDLVVEGAPAGMSSDYLPGDTIVDGLLVRRVSLLGIGDVGLTFGVAGGRNVHIVGLHVSMADAAAATARDAVGAGVGAGTGVGTTTIAASAGGVVIGAGDNVLIENSIVEGGRGDGIDLGATRSAVVSTIVRRVGRSGITLRAGGDVVDSLVFDTGGDAQLATGSGSYRVVNCTFAYHDRAGGGGAAGGTAGGNAATSGGAGGGPYAAAFGVGATAGQDMDVTLLNNLFYREPGPLDFPAGARVRAENNVFWGFPDRIVVSGARSFGPDDLASSLGVGNLVAEPSLVDPERGDFHPGVGSPLFSAGSHSEEAPQSDLLGLPRVESVTAGAFQTTHSGTPHSAVPTVSTTSTIVSTVVSTAAPTLPVFNDVPSSHAYALAVAGLASRGVVAGYGGGGGSLEFNPDAPVLRAELAKMVVRTLGLTVFESMPQPFSDLGPDDPVDLYPHEYVAAAADAGAFVGIGGGLFAPYAEISRAQAITVVVRAAANAVPTALSAAPSDFRSTLGSFDLTHDESIRTAEANSLLDGLVGFGPAWDPRAPATRGEAASILWRLFERR